MLKNSQLKISYSYILILFVLLSACKKDKKALENLSTQNITLFFVNDVHGQLENFAKIKYIVEKEKKTSEILLLSAGDLFSGNPVVDNYEDKGFPMIDIMNQVGFNLAVIGNHEFDYGEEILNKRIEQSNFDWICANLDASQSKLKQANPYYTISVGDLRITFLGLIETNGKKDDIIPSTHPLKIRNLIFEKAANVVNQYQSVKKSENSDLYIALTHLGHKGYDGKIGDFELAEHFPYFDAIIGGHSHAKIDTVINEIPIFQAGSYLNYLGKLELNISNKKIESSKFTLIDLNSELNYNSALLATINNYKQQSGLDEIIGYAEQYHGKSATGCFYVNALKSVYQTDISFQNTGGVRNVIHEGNITKKTIYEVSPFNNGIVIYDMTVGELSYFLKYSGSGFYYTGLQIIQDGQDIEVRDSNGKLLNLYTHISVAINDYVPAVHSAYFPENCELQSMTAAESLIYYLQNINNTIDFSNCYSYFRFE